MDFIHKSFDDVHLISNGNFSEIYVASDKNLRSVAIKMVNLSSLEETDRNLISNEVMITSKFRNQYVVHLYYSFIIRDYLYIVLEYCNNGDLEQEISMFCENGHHYTLNEIKLRCCQILQGLSHIHSLSIIHRDIKPDNIMMSSNNSNLLCKIGDFGLSIEIQESEELPRTLTGTPVYMAPEIIECSLYDTRVDIWSLGIVVYRLFTFNIPFSKPNLNILLNNIKTQYIIPISCCDKKFGSYVMKMLDRNQNERPTADELLQSGIFESIFSPSHTEDKILFVETPSSISSSSVSRSSSYFNQYSSPKFFHKSYDESNKNEIVKKSDQNENNEIKVRNSLNDPTESQSNSQNNRKSENSKNPLIFKSKESNSRNNIKKNIKRFSPKSNIFIHNNMKKEIYDDRKHIYSNNNNNDNNINNNISNINNTNNNNTLNPVCHKNNHINSRTPNKNLNNKPSLETKITSLENTPGTLFKSFNNSLNSFDKVRKINSEVKNVTSLSLNKNKKNQLLVLCDKYQNSKIKTPKTFKGNSNKVILPKFKPNRINMNSLNYKVNIFTQFQDDGTQKIRSNDTSLNLKNTLLYRNKSTRKSFNIVKKNRIKIRSNSLNYKQNHKQLILSPIKKDHNGIITKLSFHKKHKSVALLKKPQIAELKSKISQNLVNANKSKSFTLYKYINKPKNAISGNTNSTNKNNNSPIKNINDNNPNYVNTNSILRESNNQYQNLINNNMNNYINNYTYSRNIINNSSNDSKTIFRHSGNSLSNRNSRSGRYGRNSLNGRNDRKLRQGRNSRHSSNNRSSKNSRNSNSISVSRSRSNSIANSSGNSNINLNTSFTEHNHTKINPLIHIAQYEHHSVNKYK